MAVTDKRATESHLRSLVLVSFLGLGYMYLVVHNRSTVGFVVLHFVTIILDLNVEYVFLCTCELPAEDVQI